MKTSVRHQLKRPSAQLPRVDLPISKLANGKQYLPIKLVQITTKYHSM